MQPTTVWNRNTGVVLLLIFEKENLFLGFKGKLPKQKYYQALLYLYYREQVTVFETFLFVEKKEEMLRKIEIEIKRRERVEN